MRPIALAAFIALLGCSASPGETPSQNISLAGENEPGGFCAALSVLQHKCVRCHADPPENGAPFPLDSYAATQLPSPTSTHPDRTRADRMLEAVESNAMPDIALLLDPPVEPLSCEERTTLLTWLDSGSPPPLDGDTTCAHRAPRLLDCDAQR